MHPIHSDEGYLAPEPKGESRLFTRATLYRMLYESDPAVMREQWVAEVLQDPAMLIGLLGGEEAAGAAALRYLDGIELEIDDGLKRPARESRSADAVVRPGEGHSIGAMKATPLMSSPGRPSQSRIDGRLKAKLGNAISIFQTYRIRDGRTLGSLRYGELPRLIERGAKEDWLLLKLYQSVQAQPETLLADALKESQVEAILHEEPDMEDIRRFLAHRKEQRRG